ncbi:HAD family hydrolase [Sphingomonas sp. MA1305]|uniref:HAD family hydrolase n=1 Tax=Sphingomonas sp. MA1305 TaxID=2479204 RepID=UPI0018E02BD6|nr:HAD family hydrolase [Sphingomonas sp. MA1305]MBI0477185.1 HAD family hydrolase [Sphingomonas sp. MA1305]
MDILKPAAFTTQPACVLLDFDDTLYEYAPANAAGMDAACALARQVLNIQPRDFLDCFADARAEVKRRLGRIASSHSRLLYFQRTIERAGFRTQPLIVLNLEQAYWRAFLDVARLFPEVVDFLDDLRINGTQTVIVTDLTAQIQFRKIIHFGIDRYIDWIVTSEESGVDKPDPTNFELALAKLGGVEGPVWMIGEQPRSDIRGAREAVGAIGIQKRHAGVVVESDGAGVPDAVFDDYGSLRRFLRGLKPVG